jgi:hypothetical protein
MAQKDAFPYRVHEAVISRLQPAPPLAELLQQRAALRRQHEPRQRAALHAAWLQKRQFPGFPYVCPEPVVVKRSFYI